MSRAKGFLGGLLRGRSGALLGGGVLMGGGGGASSRGDSPCQKEYETFCIKNSGLGRREGRGMIEWNHYSNQLLPLLHSTTPLAIPPLARDGSPTPPREHGQHGQK